MRRRTRLGLGLSLVVPAILGEGQIAAAKLPFNPPAGAPATAPSGDSPAAPDSGPGAGGATGGTDLAPAPGRRTPFGRPATRPAGGGATPGGAAPGAGSSPGAAAGGNTAATVIEPSVAPPDDLTPLGFGGPAAPHPGLRGRTTAGGGGGMGSGATRLNPIESDFLPIVDRWRVGFPANYSQNVRGSIEDPYNQNVLKGDYPVFGTQDVFLNLTLTSDTLFETRRVPEPSNVSTNFPGKFGFFGQSRQSFVLQNFIVSAEIFKGDAGYQPKTFSFKATGVTDLNFVTSGELGILNPDVRLGRNRTDAHFAFQELFAEFKLADLSRNFDFVSVRAGIQEFSSDFRGFLFSDEEPGVRLFGNLDNNRWQFNLAWFYQVEKDTNSGLNTFNGRDQNVFIANVFRQDFLVPGYTASFSLHANIDKGDTFAYDRNGFLERPEPVGVIGTKQVYAYYLGWAGDGHIGRLNLTHQIYQVFGRETFNPFAGHGVDINAQMAAIELSYDFDYIRYRASFLYMSGDRNPRNGQATGFDTIFDNPNFAGSGFNYFARETIPLLGTGVELTGHNSFVPDLRTSKEEGQANFVNPGLLLYNVGADFNLTQKLTLITNASYLQFVNTSSIQEIEQVSRVRNDIGLDLSVGLEYRPFLNNNAIINVGAACLIPGNGFKDIYTSETLYSVFAAVTLTY